MVKVAGTISMEIHFPSRVRSTYYMVSRNQSIDERLPGSRLDFQTNDRLSFPRKHGWTEVMGVSRGHEILVLKIVKIEFSLFGGWSCIGGKKAAEKCFRTNWRAVIAVRARNRFHGIVDLAAQRPFGKLAVRAMKSATTPPGDNADKKTAGLAREKESRS